MKLTSVAIAVLFGINFSSYAGNLITEGPSPTDGKIHINPDDRSGNGDKGDGKIEGFLIHTDTTVSFFEDAVRQLGLESDEAITFLTPQIVDQKYALIRFEIDEDLIDQISRINAGPKPDHLKKVYMVFTDLDDKDVDVNQIKKQFESFDRDGFTVKEWGKAELPQSNAIDAL